MANILLSVRLSPRLSAILDRVTQHLDCSPSQLVEMLLRGSGTYREELLEIHVQGPLTEKRNLRLSPEAIQQLRRLTGCRELPSGGSVRSLLGYFFSKPQAFQSVVPNAPRAEEWTRVLEEEERILRAAQIPRAARPGDSRVGIFILLLPFLVLLIIGIVDLFKGSTLHQPPRAPRPPAPPNDLKEKPGEDTGHKFNQSSKEER